MVSLYKKICPSASQQKGRKSHLQASLLNTSSLLFYANLISLMIKLYLTFTNYTLYPFTINGHYR